MTLTVFGVNQRLYLDVFGDIDLTRPQVAEAGFFDHLTLIVGVRYPQGQAAAAGLRAGAPGGSLGDAVLMPAPALSGVHCN